MSMDNKFVYYGAIRRNREGVEWLDCSTIRSDRFSCQKLFEENQRYIPEFAKDHPLVRIATLRIVETVF